jgi:hypothetical protein
MTMIIEYEFEENSIKDVKQRDHSFSSDYLQFISKLKTITKEHLRENLELAYAAKLVLRQNYSVIDGNYSLHTN